MRALQSEFVGNGARAIYYITRKDTRVPAP